MVLEVNVGVLVGVVFMQGVIELGLKSGRCKMKEVWDELLVSAETEEETEELRSIELEDKGTG